MFVRTFVPLGKIAGTWQGRWIEPQIIRGRQLDKLQTPPSVRLGKVRDEFNRVNGANGPCDGQTRIQVYVEAACLWADVRSLTPSYRA